MKITPLLKTGARRACAFTTIEMVGALAIGAVLLALILAAISNSVADSHPKAATWEYLTVFKATTNHIGAYGAFNKTFGTNATPAELQNWDTGVLIPERFLVTVFNPPIGQGAAVQVVNGPGNNGTGYFLDGVNNRTANNAWTVECVITNVAAHDAYDCAFILEPKLQPKLNPNWQWGQAFYAGRVVWTNVTMNGVATTNGTGDNLGNLFLFVGGN